MRWQTLLPLINTIGICIINIIMYSESLLNKSVFSLWSQINSAFNFDLFKKFQPLEACIVLSLLLKERTLMQIPSQIHCMTAVQFLSPFLEEAIDHVEVFSESWLRGSNKLHLVVQAEKRGFFLC